jgi:hypothetical protein
MAAPKNQGIRRCRAGAGVGHVSTGKFGLESSAAAFDERASSQAAQCVSADRFILVGTARIGAAQNWNEDSHSAELGRGIPPEGPSHAMKPVKNPEPISEEELECWIMREKE